MKKLIHVFIITTLMAITSASAGAQETCPGGRSSNGAMWMSILHPGLGEYFLNGFGNWQDNMPPKKFWLGFIPGFGWPGYLQIKSAKDARECRTSDGIGWNE